MSPRTVLWSEVNPLDRFSLMKRHSELIYFQMATSYTFDLKNANVEKTLCLHELFHRQAARTPDAIALVGDNEKLTYAQANERVLLLAEYLRHHGTGIDTPVGIFMEPRFVRVSHLALNLTPKRTLFKCRLRHRLLCGAERGRVLRSPGTRVPHAYAPARHRRLEA